MSTEYKVVELTTQQKDAIKSTIPILETAGVDLTAKFYENMLNRHPELKTVFNKAHQATRSQPKILAFALLKYAENIDDLTPLTGFVTQIMVKHTGLVIKPEHYPIVGSNLIQTMLDVLGPDVATPFLLASWATAYGNLAKILIDGEQAIYSQNEWDGFKEFEVTSIESESVDVKSVQFTPADKSSKVQIPKRGQYVGIKWNLPNGLETSREYSLSSYAPLSSNKYQISVKRDSNGGVVSNFVHDSLKVGDKIRVTPPNGNLVYKDVAANTPLFAFAGGIGITPLVSIIEKALESGRKVVFYYSNNSLESRPFGKWLSELKSRYNDKFELREFITKPLGKGDAKIDEIVNRRLEKTDFTATVKDHDIYVLGPQSYMDFVFATLEGFGVKRAEISTEVFGVYKP